MNKTSIIETKDWLEFLTTKNTIEIRNEEDFKLLLILLNQKKFLKVVFRTIEQECYEYWQKLVSINSKGKFDLVFEYDIIKGITFYTDRQKSIDWYQKEPIHLKPIDNDTTCKFCGIEKQDFLLTKIQHADGYFKVCPNDFGQNLDEIVKLTPIQQHCDCCDSETAFTITTSFGEYHLCANHLIDFVCYNLDKKSFAKLFHKDSDGRCDFYLHDNFYDDDGEKLQPDDEWAEELKQGVNSDER